TWKARAPRCVGHSGPVNEIIFSPDGKLIPYVSAQAWRYWWRNTLEARFGWRMSEIKREAKIAFTSANPFTYPDDDVFGYMRAMKNTEGGTLTRLSPLKNSPLISVLPQQPTDDFGVMARHEGDPVPHGHQFYSTVLKGIFSLDLSSVGIFRETARTGYKNLDEKYTAKPEIKDAISTAGATKEDGGNWTLPKAERIKRASETIGALPYLNGGAKLALHLTDVTPKFIILAVIRGGNHLFMNITSSDPAKLVNATALKEVITDYKDVILSDVFIGRQEGFQDDLKQELEDLKTDLDGVKTVHLLSPKQAVEQFTVKLADYIN
ncbi:MAG: type I-B CRISPR-associated protein Cas7/Cst2/DevR, partial [Blastocatellia bacterium]|nr:type I-B CRISPR-associated protein Cas7/Cst2/DevR [Blastocatellia bacterium]